MLFRSANINEVLEYNLGGVQMASYEKYRLMVNHNSAGAPSFSIARASFKLKLVNNTDLTV